MALPTYTLESNAAAGAPAGAYVPADVANELEQTLAKLVWQVLYGKFHEASSIAMKAEQMLGSMAKAA